MPNESQSFGVALTRYGTCVNHSYPSSLSFTLAQVTSLGASHQAIDVLCPSGTVHSNRLQCLCLQHQDGHDFALEHDTFQTIHKTLQQLHECYKAHRCMQAPTH